MPAAQNAFTQECRKWRQHRRLSQLDLALAADISQRHLSYLETGRSKPSRDMVIRLCDAMEIPLRNRNQLLSAAGFAPSYNESQLDAPAMQPVMAALERVLQHHDPMPAYVVDRFWQVLQHNQAGKLLLDNLMQLQPGLADLVAEQGINLALLTLHPQGLRPFISNWQEIAPLLLRRLKGEADASLDQEVKTRFQHFIELIGDCGGSATQDDKPDAPALLPIIPLELSLQGIELKLFSVIATFGTPQDITTDELRIESFYALDQATLDFFSHASSHD